MSITITISKDTCNEAIMAESDSHAIANSILGHCQIEAVDHDGEFVHVTIADDNPELWWRISQPNGTPFWGFGTETDAQQFADRLNRDLDINHYAVDLADDQRDGSHDGEGFKLADELAAD